MTPIQKQMLELEVTNLALQEVNTWLVLQLRLFHASLPNATREMLVAAVATSLRQQRQAFASQVRVPIPGQDPEMEAHQVGRRLRAFDEIATAIEDRLQEEPTQDEMKLLGEIQQEQARNRSQPSPDPE